MTSTPLSNVSRLCAWGLATLCPMILLATSAPALAQSVSSSAQTSFGQTSTSSMAAPAAGWRFRLTPYVWLPTINARIDYPVSGLPGGGGGGGGIGGGGGNGNGDNGGLLDGVIESEIGPNKYLTKLNFALMLNAEARRGPWVLMGDFIGIRASGLVSGVTGFKPNLGILPDASLGATLSVGTETRISTGLATLMGGYQWIATPQWELDLLGGVRTGRLSAEMDWTLNAAVTLPNGTPALERTGTASGSKTPVDAVVGIKGHYRITERWSVPYYFDIGAGTSNLTWQAFGGVSYAFDWGNVVVAYRHLHMENDTRDVFKRFSLSGPMIGASFRF